MTPSANGNGVESLVQQQAGVSTHNELSSQYNVRGGAFDENSVYINNVEVFRPFLVRSGQQEGLSVINPYMVDKIGFSTGGYAAKEMVNALVQFGAQNGIKTVLADVAAENAGSCGVMRALGFTPTENGTFRRSGSQTEYKNLTFKKQL